jgi:hypothetical protein
MRIKTCWKARSRRARVAGFDQKLALFKPSLATLAASPRHMP